MHKYPTVNYIGNKEKISDWLVSNLPITSGTVLDLFSGGNSVSYALKDKGFTVWSNDILYSNYVLEKALIENNGVQLDFMTLDTYITEEDIIKRYESIEFLVNTLYFEDEVKELARLLLISDRLEGYPKYIFLAILRRAMIRKLPYSRMNVPWAQIIKLRDEEYSYSKYKRRRGYHNETFEAHMVACMSEFNNAIFCNNKSNKAFRSDALALLRDIDFVDMIYLDPPYPGTMNNYDAFYGLFDKMCGEELVHTDFTNKGSFVNTLEELITLASEKTNYIVISLNNKMAKVVEDLQVMLSKYGTLEVKEEKHIYKVTGKDNKHESKELLFVLKVDSFVKSDPLLFSVS